MKIQLDTKAMESLFPEGSQARVDLQTAVIANFTKKFKYKKLEEITNQQLKIIDDFAHQQTLNIIETYFDKRYDGEGRYIGKSTKKSKLVEYTNLISSDIKDEIISNIDLIIKERVEKILMDEDGALEDDINLSINKHIVNYINDNAQKLIAENLQNILLTMFNK